MLVQKKDGKPQFYMDLWKLNARIVKDFYTLLRIEDALDFLNCVLWIAALDLMSGYLQVEMDGASKPLMAFTVSLLRIYECDPMPFFLVNAPATFQRLIETCLHELQLNIHL